MIYPSIAELSDEGVNRYTLSIATAKCARKITDEQLEKAQANQEVKEEKYSSYSSKKAEALGLKINQDEARKALLNVLKSGGASPDVVQDKLKAFQDTHNVK